ncbi:MAG: DNA repair protein RecN [Robiginitomaculum sp.]|nr:MAG: DNA repair protein RecN [Robiginitomaculum sp.]
MLTELSIFDVVLIDRLVLNFSPGLTAMTGETGAGKSIVLDALGLALGARADRALVRAGCEQAKVIAVFSPEAEHPVWALLGQREIDIDPGEDLILRRSVSIDGKSKAYLNDMPISAALLREIGTLLVEIHGQHDGRGLMDVQTHVLALDAYGGHEKLVGTCSETFAAWRKAVSFADNLAKQAQTDESEHLYLQESAAEIDRLDPSPGEEQSLAATRQLMMQTEKLLQDVQSARQTLDAGPGLDAGLGGAIRHLEQAISRLGPNSDDLPIGKSLARSLRAMERTLAEFEEANSALNDAAHDLILEPTQLEQAEERLFALRALARKHQTSVDQLPEVRQDLASRLQALENLDQAQKDAKQKVETTKATYVKAAAKLSDRRQIAAKKLDTAILAELAPLRLEKAKFRTAIEALEPEAGGANGCDRVRFEISANPGTPLGPLASIASGGELSRISLAIKAALAANSGPSVMVFDEIDQGVGGAVADAVGRRLRALSGGAQVLVITHSPQVAARANAQFQIEKSEKQGTSRTDVKLLDAAQREEEIARMLAGAQITDQAREAARALLG